MGLLAAENHRSVTSEHGIHSNEQPNIVAIYQGAVRRELSYPRQQRTEGCVAGRNGRLNSLISNDVRRCRLHVPVVLPDVPTWMPGVELAYDVDGTM